MMSAHKSQGHAAHIIGYTTHKYDARRSHTNHMTARQNLRITSQQVAWRSHTKHRASSHTSYDNRTQSARGAHPTQERTATTQDDHTTNRTTITHTIIGDTRQPHNINTQSHDHRTHIIGTALQHHRITTHSAC